MAGRGPSDIRPRPVGQGGAIGIARRVQVPVACAQGRYTGRKPISTKFVDFRPEKRSFPDLAISGTGTQRIAHAIAPILKQHKGGAFMRKSGRTSEERSVLNQPTKPPGFRFFRPNPAFVAFFQ